jgi:hypothetical protein
MTKSIFILFVILLLNINAFAFTASEIDMSNALSDMSIVFGAILSVIVVLFGHKKILSLFGR